RHEGQGREHLRPLRDPAEPVAVARVGDGLPHLLFGDAQDPARLRLPRGVRPVAAVQGGESVLDELLPETQDDEEDQQVGQFGPPRASAGIMLRTASGGVHSRPEVRDLSRTTDSSTPHSPAAPLRMTYEEFLRAYDGRNAEWVEGEVIEMSPTSWENQKLADFLTAILTHF